MRFLGGLRLLLLFAFVATCVSAQIRSPQIGAVDASQSAAGPAAPVPQRIRVGGNIAAAMIEKRVAPVYPVGAEAAHISGTVVLHAIIGREGAIQQLDFISGPPLLMESAMTAVRQWRYKPYLLNGQPVEVETTINVVYVLTDSAKPSEPSQPAQSSQVSKPLADASEEPFVYEMRRGALRFENDGTGSEEISARIRVQNTLGVQHMGQLVFSYNSSNEGLEIRTVKVTKPDGRVIVAGPEVVQDLTAPVAQLAPVYTDARQKHVTVPGLATGDILEYDIVKTISQPFTPGQFWSSWDFVSDGFCLDEELDLNVPRARTLQMKNAPDTQPTIREDGDRRIFHWKTSNATAFGSNRATPPLNAFNPTILLEGLKQTPARRMIFSTFKSWSDVAEWYSGLERDRRIATPDLRAKANELVRGKKTDSEKAAAIYDYVSRNIRYVSLSFGAGRYQPHAAADVLANAYGDCKDKATLLGTMLDAEGIRNSTVLINARAEVDPDVPTPEQFDHAILVASVSGKDVWLDSTLGVGPYAYLLPQLRGKNALVVGPGTSIGIRTTPAELSNPRLYKISLETNRVADKIDMHFSFDVQGDDLEVLFRATLLQLPAAGLAQAMDQGLRSTGQTGTSFSDVKASDPFDIQNPFHLEANATGTPTQSSTHDSNSSSSISPLAGLAKEAELLAYVLPTLPTGRDTLGPTELGGPKEMFLHVKATGSPENPIVAAKPLHVTTDFAEYEASEITDGDTRVLDFHLGLKMKEIPAARSQEYAEFRKQVVDNFLHAPALAASPSTSSSLSPSVSPSNPELKSVDTNALKDLNSGNSSSAAALLEVVVARDPNFKGAWNDLGRAYLNLRLEDKAIAVLQTAIQKDPADPYAYNNLGLAYLREKKYDEAIPQFQKQIQLNSYDRYAHGNLGLTYLRMEKYVQAARELDIAAAITPQDAAVQMNLGRAYAGSGQPDKATAAFDRAVTLNPLPSTYNDAAFFMADNNFALDRAETYANSAIHSVEGNLSSISVDQVALRDLSNAAELAGSWDTLGWVKFRQGDTASAEKYLLAAWELAEGGTIGDHLGQVYEKEGRKTDAIRTYELVLATGARAQTRLRLATLLGGDQTIDSLVDIIRPEVSARRTAKIPNPQQLDGSAHFMILISRAPEPSTARFVSGDDALRSMPTAISALKFPDIFPDDTVTKIIRRGQLTCSHQSGECSLVFSAVESTDLTY